MTTTYTDKLDFAKPAKDSQGWQDEIWRSSDHYDEILNQLLQKYFTISGGFCAKETTSTVSVTSVVVNVLNEQQEYDGLTFTFKDDGDPAFPQFNTDPDKTVATRYIYVQTTTDSPPIPNFGKGILCKATPPRESDVLLALVDVSETEVVRVINCQSLKQQNSNIAPGVEVEREHSTTIVKTLTGSCRDDFDAGEWTKKQGRSYQREELNTTKRGATPDYPVDYSIVATAFQVTIYDITKPHAPMWMVLDGTVDSGSGAYAVYADVSNPITDIAFIDGRLYVTSGPSGALSIIDFNNDKRYVRKLDVDAYHVSNIKDRNVNSTALIQNYFDDVLPSANLKSIDVTRTLISTIENGLPVPTLIIAAGDNAAIVNGPGVPSGNEVVLVTGMTNVNHVEFLSHNRVGIHYNELYLSTGWFDDLTADIAVNTWRYKYYAQSGTVPRILASSSSIPGIMKNEAIGTDKGLTIIHERPVEPHNGLACEITDTYNTGWMYGDIKSCILCDTTEEDNEFDTATNKVQNGDFTSSTDNWTSVNGATLNVVSGELEITGNGGSFNSYAFQQISGLTIGKTYRWTYTAKDGTSSAWAVNLGTTQGGGEITSTGAQTGTQTNEFDFVASTTSVYVSLYVQDDALTSLFDNIEIVESDQHIGDSSFEYGTAPQLQWTLDSGVTIAGGALNFPAGTTLAENDFTPTIGDTFLLRAIVSSYTSGIFNVYDGAVANRSPDWSGTGTHEKIITIANAQSSVRSVDFVGTLTDVEWFKVTEFDRFQDPDSPVVALLGDVKKRQAVDGSEVVAYSNFSIKNFLYVYDFDVVPSSVITYWHFKFKRNGAPATYEVLFDYRSNSAISEYFQIYIDTSSTGRLVVNVYGVGTLFSLGSICDDTWHDIIITSNGTTGNITLYIDGKLDQSLAGTTNSFTFGTPSLHVGRAATGSEYPATGSLLSVLKVGQETPVTNAIEKISNDEAKWFHPGSLVSLCGYDPNVLDVSHDKATDESYITNLGAVTKIRDIQVVSPMVAQGHDYFTEVTDLSIGSNVTRLGENTFKFPGHLATNNSLSIFLKRKGDFVLLVYNYGNLEININTGTASANVGPKGLYISSFDGQNFISHTIKSNVTTTSEFYTYCWIGLFKYIDTGNVKRTSFNRGLGSFATDTPAIGLYRDEYSLQEKITELEKEISKIDNFSLMKSYTTLRYLYYGKGFYPVALYNSSGQKVYPGNYEVLWDGFEWYVDAQSAANYFIDWKRINYKSNSVRVG